MVPLFPISGLVTDQSIAERLSYDPKRNTLFVNFKDLTISSEQDIKTIVDGIRARVKQGAGDKKVKCVANYTDVSIRKDLIPAYWAAAQELGKQCYLRCALSRQLSSRRHRLTQALALPQYRAVQRRGLRG